jgi:hypothetical protein
MSDLTWGNRPEGSDGDVRDKDGNVVAGGQGVQGETCCYPGCQNAVWEKKMAEELCEAHSWLRTQVTTTRRVNRIFFVGNVCLMVGMISLYSEGINPLFIIFFVNLWAVLQQVLACINICKKHFYALLIGPVVNMLAGPRRRNERYRPTEVDGVNTPRLSSEREWTDGTDGTGADDDAGRDWLPSGVD